MRLTISFFILILIVTSLFSQSKIPPMLNVGSAWADSIISTMTLEEKIGQLIMVTTYPSQDEKNGQQLNSWIENQHIGGVLFLIIICR